MGKGKEAEDPRAVRTREDNQELRARDTPNANVSDSGNASPQLPVQFSTGRKRLPGASLTSEQHLSVAEELLSQRAASSPSSPHACLPASPASTPHPASPALPGSLFNHSSRSRHYFSALSPAAWPDPGYGGRWQQGKGCGTLTRFYHPFSEPWGATLQNTTDTQR